MQQQHTSFSFFTRLLSIVGITLLFLVIVVASPTRAFAAGECFDTTSVANSGGITITKIEGIEDTMHPSTGVMSIKIHATLKDPGAMDFWTSEDRDYTLVSAQIEASGLISPDGVESTATNISQSGPSGIIITFNSDAASFTQLDNDQRTDYALSLQAHKYIGSTSCRLTSYVVNRADDAPPPIICGDPNTIGKCESSGVPETPPADSAADSGGETSPSDEGSLLDAIKGPTNKTFDALNPLNISAELKGESTKSPYLRSFATPGGVVSRLLLFAFPIAGIILFLMIVWGGFEMVTGAANAKSMDAGKQRITAAVIGFILLFVSYWLMQLIELIFGLSIL